jgi:hypothetical protein
MLDFKSFKKINESSDNRVTLNVTIEGIDKETAQDFLKMFAFMNWTGSVGSSRSMKAFFDGDGHFRPKVTVEGYDLKDILDTEDFENGEDLDLGFGA